MTEVYPKEWRALADLPEVTKSKLKSEQEERAISLMQALNVVEIEVRFEAGGDCVNELDPTVLYNKKVGNVPDELMDKFKRLEAEMLDIIVEHMIWEKVHFYEVSDGHYMGEHGHITIYVDSDEEDYLQFDKYRTAEYEESGSAKGSLTLNPAYDIHLYNGDEAYRYNQKFREFILTHVSELQDINHWDRNQVLYRKDFVAVDTDAEFLEYLTDCMKLKYVSCHFEVDNEYDLEDGYQDDGDNTYEFPDIDQQSVYLSDEGMVCIKGNMLYRYRYYTDSND